MVPVPASSSCACCSARLCMMFTQAVRASARASGADERGPTATSGSNRGAHPELFELRLTHGGRVADDELDLQPRVAALELGRDPAALHASEHAPACPEPQRAPPR